MKTKNLEQVMKGEYSNVVIFYFDKGDEAEASLLTAKDVLKSLPGAQSLAISQWDWYPTVSRIDKNIIKN